VRTETPCGVTRKGPVPKIGAG